MKPITNLNANKLFAQNEKLARFALHRHFPLLAWNDREDVLSVAYIGLWKACRIYNPLRGYRFSTLAMRCMLNEFKREGLLRSEAARQGDYVDGRPRVVSLDSRYGKGDAGASMRQDTFADVILLAGEESDPVAQLLRAEELNEHIPTIAAWWNKMPRSVKMRLGTETNEAITEVFGDRLTFVPTDAEIAAREAYRERTNARNRMRERGEPLPPKQKSGPKPRLATATA